VPCASYLTKYPLNFPMNILYSFNFSANPGYNKFILPQPIEVPQGSLVFLTQFTDSTSVAIDSSGSAMYSDVVWGTNLQNLSSNSNWRLFLNPFTNFTSYQTSFSISHAYNTIGLYNIILTFLSSNLTFQQTVNITDCKFY